MNQCLAAGLIQHATSPYSSPLVVTPKSLAVFGPTLQETQRHQQTQSAAHPARGSGPGLFGKITRFFPSRPRIIIPSINRA